MYANIESDLSRTAAYRISQEPQRNKPLITGPTIS